MIKCILEKIIDETHDTKTFRLIPEKKISFKPGQFLMFHILDTSGKSVASKPYSISSSPLDPHIDFTIKLHANFTTKLWQLNAGEKVGVTGPFGLFVLDDSIKSASMIAAGVGIAPFMCMIRYAVAKLPDCKINLLYSNRTAQDMIFYDELVLMQRKYKNFNLVCTVTRKQADGFEYGRITSDVLSRHTNIGDTFFLCGSDDFVKDMRYIIMEKQVPNSRILAERFGEFS